MAGFFDSISGLFNVQDPARASGIRGAMLGAARAIGQPYGNIGDAFTGAGMGYQQGQDDYSQRAMNELRLKLAQSQLTQDQEQRAALNNLLRGTPQAPLQNTAPQAPVMSTMDDGSQVPMAAPQPTPQPQGQPPFKLPAGFPSWDAFKAYALVDRADAMKRLTAPPEKPIDGSPGHHYFDPQTHQEVFSVPDAVKPPIVHNFREGDKDVTKQYDPATGTWKTLSTGNAFKPEAAPDAPDPSTIDYWAHSVAAGQPLPPLGMGKEAALYRQAILKRAAEINTGQGLGGADQNVNIATTKANSGALAKQTALRSATEGFENTMLQNMNVVRDLMKKGTGTTGIPILNRYQRYIRGEYQGDPDVVALNNAIDTVADENAKIRSGTLGNTPATDSMRANIKTGLNGAMTTGQIESAFGVMTKDAGNRSRSLRAQEAALKKGLQGGSDMPSIPGVSEPQDQPASNNGGSIPAPAIQMLKMNPKLRDQFDAKYGKGAAAKVLGK